MIFLLFIYIKDANDKIKNNQEPYSPCLQKLSNIPIKMSKNIISGGKKMFNRKIHLEALKIELFSLIRPHIACEFMKKHVMT